MEELNLAKNSEELRKMIMDNPELPIVVLAGPDATDGYTSMYCSNVSCSIGEILDCDVPFSTQVYTDRDEFEEDLINNHLCECGLMSDAAFDRFIKSELAKYEPYWKKAIVIYADN